MNYMGDYDLTETVHIPFNTFSSNDPSASVTVTDLALGDIEIHKDGSATQRASDSGVTVDIDFDSITGNHMVHIDLSDNDDDGFYAAGSRYQVRLEGITVDAATLNVWIGTFSIGCMLRPATAGRTLDADASGKVLLGDGAHGGSAAVITAERIIVASTTAGQPAVKLTGNTTGAGLEANGGATSGNGITALGGASDGQGIYARGDGSGAGIRADGGDTHGPGIYGIGGSTNGDGIKGVGAGTGSGVSASSGNGATGNGITVVSAATNGDGIRSTGAGSGHGIAGAAGLTGHGLSVVGGGTSGHGIYAKAAGTGNGIDAHGGGIEGDGIYAIADNDGDGVEAVGAGVGNVDIRADITGNITGNVSGTIGELAAQAKADVNAEVDSALSDYDPPTNTEMVAAFTEIKGATWAAGTDTLEHIRDKETDIESDTAEIGVAGAGLTEIAIGDGGIQASTLAVDVAPEIADAVAGVQIEVQGTYTLQQAMSICLAVLAGVTTNGGATLKTPNGAATRVTATINASNERESMTLAPSA
jgi:hypothetical protein